MTGMPCSDKSFAVPPVDSNSMPLALRDRQKSIIPVLSETLISARFIFLFMKISGERIVKETGMQIYQ
jgi:hypothetical protein